MPTETVTDAAKSDPAKALRDALGERTNLPINPAVFLKLMELSGSPDASVADYANVISASNSLAAKVISTVNSSWYGVRHSVYNILQATNLLGTLNVRILAITHCLAAIHEGLNLPKDILNHYQESSLIKATAARYLIERANPEMADQAFLAALMQDIALPIMHKIQPELYEEAFFTGATPSTELCRSEEETFGLDHGHAGDILAKRLGVTAPMRSLICHHHDPQAMAEASDQVDLVESALFAGHFPHMVICWDKAATEGAAELVERRLGEEVGSFETALGEIQDRFTQLAERVRPADPYSADLPALLRQATREMADTEENAVDESAGGHDGEADGSPARPGGKQSEFDGITGLLSRLGVMQVGSAALQESRNSEGAVSVMSIGIDDFEAISKRLGRDAADDVLRHVARLVQQTLGTRWITGRDRAGEMVAIAVGLEASDDPKAVAEKLVETVAGNAVQSNDQTIPVTLSIGGIHLQAAPSGARLDDLLKLTETLEWQSQLSGGGAVTFDRYDRRA